MTIAIFQSFGESKFKQFDPSKPINSNEYEIVFKGEVACDDLEDVYRIFNISIPKEHRGHSLSVSDIVQVIESEQIDAGFYFCDSIGFKNVEFSVPKREHKIANPELKFIYGAMGAGKSAHLLVELNHYREKEIKLWVIKPDTDTRDKRKFICSRNGQRAPCEIIDKDTDIYCFFESVSADVIIADEAQFFTEKQIQQLRDIVNDYGVSVICYGLKTDFRMKFFEGSKALVELADEIVEIESVCRCGRKATINARLDENGNVITDGNQIQIGGSESYEGMCYTCWKSKRKAK